MTSVFHYILSFSLIFILFAEKILIVFCCANNISFTMVQPPHILMMINSNVNSSRMSESQTMLTKSPLYYEIVNGLSTMFPGELKSGIVFNVLQDKIVAQDFTCHITSGLIIS